MNGTEENEVSCSRALYGGRREKLGGEKVEGRKT